jgi:hypothetical protein
MSHIPYLALVAAMLISVPAAADEAKSSSPTPRQMAHCMMARVKVERNENYKTAFKACREQLESVSSETRPPAMNAMNNVEDAENSKP